MKTNDGVSYLTESLAADDRILSAQEKDLLARLLQHAKSANGCGEAMSAVIARAVGEVVSERAQLVLGKTIIQLLQGHTHSVGSPPMTPPGPIDPNSPKPPGPNPPGVSTVRSTMRAGNPPMTPPGPIDPNSPKPPGPNPPGVSTVRSTMQAGNPPMTPPGPIDPNSPKPPGPNPPGTGSREAVVVAVAERDQTVRADFLRADCVLLDEFLPPAELQALTQYVLQKEMEFQISEVVSPGLPGGTVDFESRRSRVLMELGPHYDVLMNRLRTALPGVLRKLGHPSFEVTRVEAQVTASNDGDYFHWHCDNGVDEIARREITFVYFFHREPKPFRGGELRIYDSRLEDGGYRPTEHYRAVVPEQNQAVMFLSSLTHEITPVETPSRVFADSRFTVNGWFHR
jgi:Rps23 Pro-64 3,4-dihydroxylase Tpa1-like proline 4-hydroxylase